MADSVIIIEVLDKIYNLLVKMEERLENIEVHLKEYKPKEEESKRLLNE